MNSSNKLTRRNFLFKLGALASAVAGGFATPNVWAEAAKGQLTGASLTGTSKSLTFTLKLNEAVKYKVFTLSSPDRVVIDLLDTKLAGKLKRGTHDRPPLKAIRYAAREDGRLRVVLDMREEVKASAKIQGNTLKVTMKPTGRGSTAKAKQAPSDKQQKPVTKKPASGRFIVAIDPGHGGRDPGAVGPAGTREKDVVLQVARRLQKKINADKGMKAVLTRDKDTYIPLRKRMDIAHKHKADLFISVHADANPSSRVRGSSVYILSERGASSEAARLLAVSENSYDIKFGNRSLHKRDSKVASVLLDLSQNAMIDRSLNVAKGVLGELSKVNNPLRRTVESARFVVLRSPDIPSMLVETAFISNPTEEKRLRTADYQQKLANAMFRGVKKYQVAYADNKQMNT